MEDHRRAVITQYSLDALVSWMESQWRSHVEGAKHIASMTVPVWTALIVSFVSMITSWGNVMGYLGLAGVMGFSIVGFTLVQGNRKCRASADCFLYIWLGVLYSKMKTLEEVRAKILKVFPEFEAGLETRYG